MIENALAWLCSVAAGAWREPCRRGPARNSWEDLSRMRLRSAVTATRWTRADSCLTRDAWPSAAE